MKVPHGATGQVDWNDADLDPTGWRFHVPGEVRRQWDQLGSETKTTVAYMAQQSAEREGARKIIKKGKLAGGLDK